MKKCIPISIWSALIILMMFSTQVFANALVISNTSLTGQNTSTQTWQVRFNITWDNSWKDNVNWDAVWIFCKYRVGTNAWGHATLNASGFQTGSGTPISINVSCDQKGAFISRRDIGSGTLATTQVELRWNYGTDGVLNSDAPDLNVYAIEMVYIPRGPFTIGDGNGVNSSSSGSLYAVAQHLPYTIDDLMSPNISATSNITNASSSPANFIRIDGDGGLDLNLDGTVDSAFFPTGFNAFYMMKYEMTQGQYTDFLNTLTYTQQTNHVNNATNVLGASIVDATIGTNPNRNTILVQTIGVSPGTPRVYATSRPDRAINHVNPSDMLAYLDWAALRPITELEFEKASRGPLASTTGEYAWGNTSMNNNSSITLSGTENGTETITTPTGFNALSNSLTVSQGDGGSGPLRVGILANSGTNKFSAGASFYGVMNFNDHGHEVLVTLANVAGRSYRGDHGNGLLNSNGFADVPHWPGSSNNTTVTVANSGTNTGIQTGTAGLGYKNSTSSISARNNIVSVTTTRTSTPNLYGTMRGARTAFSADFSEVLPNGAFISPNSAISFNAASTATSYSWTFPSASPGTSTLASPSVSWASAGTYNVSLTATTGSCSSTISRVLDVLPACTNPAVLSGTTTWTQNNASYSNSNLNTNSSYGPTRLFDGNVTGNNGTFFMDQSCCNYSNPIWAIADFGSVVNLNGIGIWTFYIGDPNYNATDYILEGGSSLTGPWNPVSAGSLSRTTDNWQNMSFPPASYRYWKMTFSNNTFYYVSVREVRFNRCN